MSIWTRLPAPGANADANTRRTDADAHPRTIVIIAAPFDIAFPGCVIVAVTVFLDDHPAGVPGAIAAACLVANQPHVANFPSAP